MRHILTLGLAALIAAGLPCRATAATLRVAAGTPDLQAVLDSAADGDEIMLAPGTYRGPLRLTHRLTLSGVAGSVITGEGQG
ncbi:MAG: nitrous oxide reductase family maturation protein NosD, partial [Bradyrhizobium sp.]|nr:nitrous oxide reductase family maturation protein NosD [Bradyrhizobium sp.]